MLKYRRIILLILFTFFFFIFELLTLTDYGTDWDTINHFPRGQAYLHYFLTKNASYKNLPELIKYHQDENALLFSPNNPKINIPNRSIYQPTGYDANYFLDKDGGHPPLSDILASFSNLIFFQKLRIINDIDAYRIYIISLSSMLVGTIFWWVQVRYGSFAAIITTLSLTLYPLFLSESHFNVKDIPQTSFYSFTLLCFFEGIIRRKKILIFISSVFFGFALGTKFNIIFSPLILIFWTLIYLFSAKKVVKNYSSFIVPIIIYPAIAFAIFYISWPYLWKSPIQNFLEIISYYKNIGINPNFDARYLVYGFNTYALQWIFFTTPLVILFLSIVGIGYALRFGFPEKNKTSIFVLLWFIIPILRVSVPNAGIYGGVRQIMEYIPAMAILSGIGANYLVQSVKSKVQSHSSKFRIFNFKLKISTFNFELLTLLLFIPITLKLISIHPNQNVYFNPLIGGLKGAREKEIPYWGNSFGNPYRQAVQWVNQHAETNAKLVLAQELMPNLPEIWVRDDIQFSNYYRSGFLKKGEYVIGLNYGSESNQSYYSSRYYNRTLIPLYTIKVDETSIASIWKNDPQHIKKKFLKEDKLSNVYFEESKNGVLIDLKKTIVLSKMELKFNGNKCDDPKQIYFEVSKDSRLWQKTPHILPNEFPIPTVQNFPDKNTLFYPFAAETARYIFISIDPENSCPKKIENAMIYYYPDAN